MHAGKEATLMPYIHSKRQEMLCVPWAVTLWLKRASTIVTPWSPPIRAQYLYRSGPMTVLHSDCREEDEADDAYLRLAAHISLLGQQVGTAPWLPGRLLHLRTLVAFQCVFMAWCPCKEIICSRCPFGIREPRKSATFEFLEWTSLI